MGAFEYKSGWMQQCDWMFSSNDPECYEKRVLSSEKELYKTLVQDEFNPVSQPEPPI